MSADSGNDERGFRDREHRKLNAQKWRSASGLFFFLNEGSNRAAETTYLHAAASATGLRWPLPDELDNSALEARVFARPATARVQVLPASGPLHHELKKRA